MVIVTNSERIRRLRRNLAELLVAQAPNSRAIQDIAVRCGVIKVRYEFIMTNVFYADVVSVFVPRCGS